MDLMQLEVACVVYVTKLVEYADTREGPPIQTNCLNAGKQHKLRIVTDS
jgi:hypothetical protein